LKIERWYSIITKNRKLRFEWRLIMHVSYNRLWKLLIDKGINKSQLCKQAKISTNAMAKLGKNEDVRVEVLTKICEELRCSIGEIMELVEDDERIDG
jgi:putative transcriptional regulator